MGIQRIRRELRWGTHHQTASEMQRRMEDTPCEREPISPVLDQAIYDLLYTLTTLYEQLLNMHEHRVHSVPDRIVSIRQPWARPISSGARHTPTRKSARSFTSLRMLPTEGIGRHNLPKPRNHRLVQGSRHSAHRPCPRPPPKGSGGDENRPSAGVSGHL